MANLCLIHPSVGRDDNRLRLRELITYGGGEVHHLRLGIGGDEAPLPRGRGVVVADAGHDEVLALGRLLRFGALCRGTGQSNHLSTLAAV